MAKKLIIRLIWTAALLALTFIVACKEIDTVYRLISLCIIAVVVFATPYVQLLRKKYRREN
jgi:hypothetical protein